MDIVYNIINSLWRRRGSILTEMMLLLFHTKYVYVCIYIYIYIYTAEFVKVLEILTLLIYAMRTRSSISTLTTSPLRLTVSMIRTTTDSPSVICQTMVCARCAGIGSPPCCKSVGISSTTFMSRRPKNELYSAPPCIPTRIFVRPKMSIVFDKFVDHSTSRNRSPPYRRRRKSATSPTLTMWRRDFRLYFRSTRTMNDAKTSGVVVKRKKITHLVPELDEWAERCRRWWSLLPVLALLSTAATGRCLFTKLLSTGCCRLLLTRSPTWAVSSHRCNRSTCITRRSRMNFLAAVCWSKSIKSYSIRRNFFSLRIIKPWNLLPASNDNFNSFTSFKRFLNNCDLPNLCKY